jgi:hypothetical protein
MVTLLVEAFALVENKKCESSPPIFPPLFGFPWNFSSETSDFSGLQALNGPKNFWAPRRRLSNRDSSNHVAQTGASKPKHFEQS